MGTQISKPTGPILMPPNCKLYSKMVLTSVGEQQYIREIIGKRTNLFTNQHVCTVSGFQFLTPERRKISCEDSRELVVFYDSFDYLLSDVGLEKYTFTEPEICTLLYCIVDALIYLNTHNYHHGDVSLSKICRKGTTWKLIDKTFIKNGITAYERVLEGEEGFISPEQMERIRYGFVRESPPIVESDDVFALGMVILQLATRKSSMECYKQSFIRYNQEVIHTRLNMVSRNYSQQFYRLVQRMLHPIDQLRIGLKTICTHPLIFKSQKYSLKNTNHNQSRISLKSSNMFTVVKKPSPILSQTTQQPSMYSSYMQKQ